MPNVRRSPWFALAVLALGCVPDFDDDTSRVTAPRVVAVQAEPAEAAEGERVTLRALVVAPDESAPTPVDWSLCSDRKALSELGPVSQRCLVSPELAPPIGAPLGRGAGADAAVALGLPLGACQAFGPQLPDPTPGEPTARPVDPDPTGGFYQPVVAWLDRAAVIGGVRLACPLIGSTRQGLVSYNQHYRRNQAPTPSALEAIRDDGSRLALDADEAPTLGAGEKLRVRVLWPACPDAPACGDGICALDESALGEEQAAPDQLSCPEDCSVPRGCGGLERYVLYDSLGQRLLERRESFVVSWYATSGRFDGPRTDEVENPTDDGTPGTQNGWTAPNEAGVLRLWAVVRDDRGGVSWISGGVRISP